MMMMMFQRKKKSQLPSKNYEYAKDIGKVMQFESRLFKTLENGVVCHTSDSSPDVSPEKIRVHKLAPSTTNPKLKTGFESGYLGNSMCIHDTSSGYGSDTENNSTTATIKQRRTPVLKRSSSLTVLSPVPEEQESAFLQPHLVNVHPPIQPLSPAEYDKKEQGFARKLRFFDVRNLRLSFRKKANKEPDTKRRFVPSASLNPIQSIVHRPTSVTYQNNCYFERPVADCVSCTRLLKDPRYCECPPQARRREPLVKTSSSLSRKGSGRYSLSKDLSLMNEDSGSYQRSIQLYGTVKRREKKKDPQDEAAEIRKSLARFSVTPSFVESIPYASVTKNTKNDDTSTLSNNNSRPKESGISLVKDLKLEFMHNKWICDVTVTRKNDFVITDLKNAYLLDRDGNLKLTVGSKGHKRLQAPNSITTDNLGNLVILDQSTQMIQMYSLKGQLLSTLEDNNITAKSRIVCNNKNQILVTSTDKRKINVHSQNNHHLYSISSSSCQSSTDDNARLQFYQPFSIAINHLTGDIIIGDDHKELVIAMTCFGKPKWCFTPPGDRNRSFFPNSICTDNNGYIFVADLYEEKIYMLDSSGKYLKTLLSRVNGLKGGPVAIATDALGHLLVADEEKTLKIFKYGEKGFALYRRFSYCPNNV